jgi:putative peptidoglycan lipid II flippase
MRQIAFFVIPSLIGYLVLGDIIVAALYEGGEFERDDTVFVYAVLGAMSLGLIASTGTRLYSSTFFALRDTRTPARIALIRLVVMGAIGASIMFPLERYTLRGHGLGAIGLALAGALAAWVEWYLLRRVLTRRVGAVALDVGHWAVIVPAAIAAATVARGVSWVLPPLHPILVAVVVLVPFGLVYFGITGLFGVGEASRVLQRFRPAKR